MERDFINEEDDPSNPNRRPKYLEDIYTPPTRADDDPYWTQQPIDGIGTPESGYGWGGVDNPAYVDPNAPAPNPKANLMEKGPTSDENTRMFDPTTPTGRPPAAPTPSFQPPAPQMSGAPAAAAPAAQTATIKQPGITDEVTRILMERLKALQNPGDIASDPLYQQSVRQYQIGQLRAADKDRKALAERNAASGTRASGGFNVGVRGITERAGENSARYRSGLAMDRLGAREQQLVQAIALARSVGQDEIANQLELQRLQLQQELGRGDLALRGELGRGQLDLGRGQLGLGYDQLGLSYADMVMRANRDATLAAL